jgi:hypothetical protein
MLSTTLRPLQSSGTWARIGPEGRKVLAAQRVYGVPAPDGPVVHLQQATGGDIFGAYVASFERTWTEARPWTG